MRRFIFINFQAGVLTYICKYKKRIETQFAN